MSVVTFEVEYIRGTAKVQRGGQSNGVNVVNNMELRVNDIITTSNNSEVKIRVYKDGDPHCFIPIGSNQTRTLKLPSNEPGLVVNASGGCEALFTVVTERRNYYIFVERNEFRDKQFLHYSMYRVLINAFVKKLRETIGRNGVVKFISDMHCTCLDFGGCSRRCTIPENIGAKRKPTKQEFLNVLKDDNAVVFNSGHGAPDRAAMYFQNVAVTPNDIEKRQNVRLYNYVCSQKQYESQWQQKLPNATFYYYARTNEGVALAQLVNDLAGEINNISPETINYGFEYRECMFKPAGDLHAGCIHFPNRNPVIGERQNMTIPPCCFNKGNEQCNFLQTSYIWAFSNESHKSGNSRYEKYQFLPNDYIVDAMSGK